MDMSLLRIGTLGAHMKNMEKAAMWDLKQKSGDLTSHKKTLDEWLEATRQDPVISEQIEAQKKQDDPDVQAIYYKVQMGKKLTAEEMKYLQANDPETYAKAVSIQQERKAYEWDLKRCKTQEDVQRLKLTQISQSLSTVKEISSNPNIPLEKKLQYAMLENAKVKAIAEETARFIKSGEYAELPTEAEVRQAEREMKEEGQAAQTEGTEEQTEDTEKKADLEKQFEEEVGKIFTQAAEKIMEGSIDTEDNRQHDEAEMIESEEEKKTKRARAKAAYAEFSGPDAEAEALAAEVVSFSKSV